jgi:hypothetical protein
MELYSYHVFLFPFHWQFVGKEMKHKTLEDRTCLKELKELFQGTKWQTKPYEIDKVLNYNEYNYFYGMVRDVLFDEGKENTKNLISNYFYDIQPDQFSYNFKVSVDASKGLFESFSLHIESIILHLYSTGVGVLSFHLNNRIKEQSSPDQILMINQAGRRIFPPFFGMDYDLIGKQDQWEFKDFGFGLEKVKGSELAVEFKLFEGHASEDFGRYANPENFKENPFQIPEHFEYLFHGLPFTVKKSDFQSDATKVYITPLLDDRMFVLCWYGDDKLSNTLLEETGKTPEGIKILNYESNDWWYKFMFNDQKWATCQNDKMKRDLIREHTYYRWSDYGTFFGINRYSFVCLTSSLDKLKRPDINAAYLVNHMQTMYYKIAELCLVQRACLLRFSEEVTGISNMEDNKKIDLSTRVGNLYKQYLLFVNRIYFREVTAQEQGIEIYGMMHKHMQIERGVKDLEQEIKELHEYVSLMQQQRQNRNIELLTLIGALFVIPTFLISFFGIIVFPFEVDKEFLRSWGSAWFLLPLILGPVIYLLINKSKGEKISWKLFSKLLFFIILTIGLALLYNWCIVIH